MISPRPFADGRQAAVLVVHRLEPGTAHVRAWCRRVQALDAAGWATHAVVLRAEPDLGATITSLRTDCGLPATTAIHHFAMRDRRVRAAWWAPRPEGEPVAVRMADWLDWLTAQVPGSTVIADGTAAHGPVAAMSNPLVARIAAVGHDPDPWWGPSGPGGYPDPDSDPDPGTADRPTPGPVLAAFDAVVVTDHARADALRAVAGTAAGAPRIVVIPDGGADAGVHQPAPPSALSRWVSLAGELAAQACDRGTPSLLVDSVATTARILRLSGVLADSANGLESWTFELPTLQEPAGWMVDPPPVVAPEDADEDDLPVHPHAQGPTREMVCELRSNALAFVANRVGPFRIQYTDGTHTVPLQALQFDSRLVASRAGNAAMVRQPDGSIEVTAVPELRYAHITEGRLLARLEEGGTPSDVTHSLSWGCDIDWVDLTPTPLGATFRGRLRTTKIPPADDSPPAICITDVAGYSRPVGQLHFAGEPTIDGLSWSRPVSGVLETDPLVATTQLAGGALALHVGFRGMLVPVGGLWTHGHRSRMRLTCPRGSVTLLPSPGGRVLVAPGHGLRARTSGAVRRVLSRG